MRLYLIQHGLAASEEQDPLRPLTPEGRSEVLRMAAYAARLKLDPARILHSGKLRAQETAELFAAALNPSGGISVLEGLGPNDPPEATAQALASFRAPAMLVGHLPHLSKLAGLLVTGDSGREVIAFKNAALNALQRSGNAWRIAWILPPELLPA